MRTVDDVVDTFRFVVDRDAGCIVVAEPHARHDVHAVSLVAADRNWRHVRDRLGIECALRRTRKLWAGRRLVEVVALTGLVVNKIDDANRIGAERILPSRVGVSARIWNWRRDRLDDADIHGLAVGLTLHLIEAAVVGSVQRTRGAVGGHTGSARAAIDVTRPLRPARNRPALSGRRQRCTHQRERQCDERDNSDSRFHSGRIASSGTAAVRIRTGCGARFATRAQFLATRSKRV